MLGTSVATSFFSAVDLDESIDLYEAVLGRNGKRVITGRFG